MRYRIKSYLIFSLIIYTGYAYAQNPGSPDFQSSDSYDNVIGNKKSQSLNRETGYLIAPERLIRKQYYINTGYILPAWGIDESSARIKSNGGISVRIGFIGRKQIGGHISFTHQIYKLNYDTTFLLPQQYNLKYLYSNVTGIELGGDFLFIRTPDVMLGMSVGIASSFGSNRYLSVSNGGLNGGIFFSRKHINFSFTMQKLRGEALIYVDNGNGYYDPVYNVFSLINYTLGIGYTF